MNKQDKAITKKKEVVRYLLSLITTGKIQPNEVMPSEHFLMNKFDYSRITMINAFSELESVGAIYTRNKIGRYAAEHFYGFTKSYSSLINYKYSTTQAQRRILESTDPAWFEENTVVFLVGYKTYKKTYFNDKNEEIMFADHYVSKKYELPENMDKHFSIYEHLIHNEENSVLTLTYKVVYETVNKWGYEKLAVVYVWGYDESGISVASRYVVHPDYFVFQHGEVNIL
ncbi:GntR family transcriptional regulator [Mycoplasma procyoni]|uniref:GntR family transcriptional regulator n=1 Tax=Mycoplasma procyoni TaxID=568784 RepID=UPI00197C822D|nr:GntR family transcriptional regulator [Mycoplasma procyoni]MBN3534514.1 GntR family transcriptional regulator [Mycoplasma procyoni]